MKVSIISILLLSSHLLLAQSGWVKDKNQLYAQVSYTSFKSKDYYSLDGQLLDVASFKQRSVGIYAEYGLGNRLALEYNQVLYRSNGFNTTETVSGFGDVFIGLKYALNRGKFPVSITVGPEIPIGNSDLVSRNLDDPSSFLFLPTGDGEWNILNTIAASHSIDNIYFSFFTTFNLRTEYQGNDFSNQLRSGLEIGYSPTEKLWLQAKSRIQITFGDEPASTDILRGEGTEFSLFELGGSYAIAKNYLIIGNTSFYSDFLVSRKNLYSAPVFSLGLAFNMN